MAGRQATGNQVDSRLQRRLSAPVVASQASSPRNGPNQVRFHFVDGAFLEISGAAAETYRVCFVDSRSDEILHETLITNNAWARTAIQYFMPWTLAVTRMSDQALVFAHRYDARQRRVYIALESRSLGDTLAWLPAVEEFRRVHGCRLICSTFMNPLFAAAYPAIEFVAPGETVHDLYAMYRLGFFYQDDGAIDKQRHPVDFRSQPLAKAACDSLGLPYRERRPQLAVADGPRPIIEPYVCIAVHATAQAKYWNNPDGWPTVVAYLIRRGLRVVLLSREGHEYMGNRAPPKAEVIPEGPLETVVGYLRHARFFIGIGSGLSWLAWAVGCRTCLISGFSDPWTEPAECLRIFPETVEVCTGCFNRYRLDPSDWNWCPVHGDDEARRFECTRAITPDHVIESIASWL